MRRGGKGISVQPLLIRYIEEKKKIFLSRIIILIKIKG